jgi:diguanylate cyclase (GGDEF)-like protein
MNTRERLRRRFDGLEQIASMPTPVPFRDGARSIVQLIETDPILAAVLAGLREKFDERLKGSVLEILTHLKAPPQSKSDAERAFFGYLALKEIAEASNSDQITAKLAEALRVDWKKQDQRGPAIFHAYALPLRDYMEEQLEAQPPKPSWRDDDPSRRDELLSIGSKKVYDEDLESAVGEIQEGEPLALLFIDVDDFKSINEKYGHEPGNQVLRSIAAVVSSCVRGKGKAYRWGGDELAALLPNSDRSEAAATADRIRVGVEKLNFGRANLRATVTIGVAVGTEPSAKQFRGVFDAADAAVREAKRNRRKNSVVLEPGAAVPSDPAPDRRVEPSVASESNDLEEVEIKILAALSDLDDQDATVVENLASRFQLKPQKMLYHLERLMARQLVFNRINRGEPTRYFLKRAGRELLVEKKLL